MALGWAVEDRAMWKTMFVCCIAVKSLGVVVMEGG